MRNVRVGRESCGASRFEGPGATDYRGEINVNTERLIDALRINLEPGVDDTRLRMRGIAERPAEQALGRRGAQRRQ